MKAVAAARSARAAASTATSAANSVSHHLTTSGRETVRRAQGAADIFHSGYYYQNGENQFITENSRRANGVYIQEQGQIMKTFPVIRHGFGTTKNRKRALNNRLDFLKKYPYYRTKKYHIKGYRPSRGGSKKKSKRNYTQKRR